MFFLFPETQRRFSRVPCAVCLPAKMDVISQALQNLQTANNIVRGNIIVTALPRYAHILI